MSKNKTWIHAASAALAALALLGLYAWYIGPPWNPRFSLEWDEEVRLHDARIINIHIKRTYERTSLLSRWDGVHRATEISFDAGPPMGRFTTGFQGYDVAMLESKDQVWYFGLVRIAGTRTMRQNGWQLPFLMLRPDGHLGEAAETDTLPAEFVKWNVMPGNAPPEVLARFDHTHVQLADKMRQWAAFPGISNDVVRMGRKNPE